MMAFRARQMSQTLRPPVRRPMEDEHFMAQYRREHQHASHGCAAVLMLCIAAWMIVIAIAVWVRSAK